MNLLRPTFVVLVLAAVACQRGGGSTNSELSTTTAAPATVASAPPTLPTSSTSGVTRSGATPESPPDECMPGQRVAPPTLAASWPARIGTRVRFRSHVDVAVDVMTAVVVASGHRFVVVASPDQLWQGDKERTFTVMGSKTVSLGGRTTLPQLLLEAECSP